LRGTGGLTGPAEGKLPLEARVILHLNGERRELKEAEVYVHLKGYALARVTHLDVEHGFLNTFFKPKGGRFLTIVGVDGGLEVRFQKGKIMILSLLLNRVLGPGEATRTWVGGKYGGIYIGFRKAQIERLEGLAETLKTSLAHYLQG
jgi:hypothetical protein